MVRLLRAGALSALLALVAGSAPLGAQAGTTTGATAATQYPAQERDGGGFDPGWLGLLGLLGLAGLRRRREEPVVRRDVDATTTRRV
jgi:MYXO-CTERM domain-containing protein